MNDRRINELVRMALEVEELESADGAGEGPGLRLVGGDAEVSPLRAHRAWWVGAGLAVAATIAGALALPTLMSSPAPAPAGDIAVKPIVPANPAEDPIIRHQPLVVRPQEQANALPGPATAPLLERPDLGAVEKCIVVAIYRDTRGGMPCVKIQPHVWSENKCLNEVSQSELRSITLGQPCSPGANQTLLVALSGPQRELPKTENDAAGLAACILGSRDCGSDSRCLAHAAADCLPAHVSVRLEAVASSR